MTMRPLPAQRRPPCTRRCERYPSVVLLTAAVTVRAAVGWQLLQACRLPDGTLEAVYERSW